MYHLIDERLYCIGVQNVQGNTAQYRFDVDSDFFFVTVTGRCLDVMVTALMIRPMEHPRITQLCDNRDYLDHAVSEGTDMLCNASVLSVEKDIAAIYAQENLALSLHANRKISKRILCGTVYIVGVAGGKLRSLTDDEITKYSLRFWEPEVFSQDEIVDSWFDGLFCTL